MNRVESHNSQDVNQGSSGDDFGALSFPAKNSAGQAASIPAQAQPGELFSLHSMPQESQEESMASSHSVEQGGSIVARIGPIPKVTSTLEEVRSELHQFIQENLHCMPEIGFIAEEAPSVSAERIQSVLEEASARLHLLSLETDVVTRTGIAYAEFAAKGAECIDEMLYALRSHGFAAYVPEGEQEALFLTSLQLKSDLTSIALALQSAEAQSLMQQEVERALAQIEPDSLDGNVYIEPEAGSLLAENLLKQQEWIHGGDSGIRESAELLFRTMHAISTEYGKVARPRIGFSKSPEQVSQMPVDDFVRSLEEVSQAMEDAFMLTEGSTPVDIHRRSFAHNVGLFAESLRIRLVRRGYAGVIGANDVPHVLQLFSDTQSQLGKVIRHFSKPPANEKT